ncbi:carboxylesterase family protein [Conexibacter stalactiti]|uniref:Carboxylic ester hydrolase n=1 Tax=Conexibacter stalactiti TaxID=1940611 RepID=A0ABU4HNY4_9ACTN|nr:carboxylesterase family protein [Conexibacter stalactiti]MDW5593764.1 carboxylesterase family protein [Conexibacter stalactiti]MEC5034406.1 carboxylesterase family protein [Conexibacter stalactiti]
MDAVASTTYGRVRGTVEDGVAVFRGVPYAAAPVGSLRFAPPVAPASWDGERDATAYGPAAPQIGLDGVAAEIFAPAFPSGEDCLSLNVWTPDLGGAGLPVLVWIHGGAFLFGGSGDDLLDRGAFARSGVVVVSVNYRLGLDGFLHVDGDPAGGNYGTLDQLAALRWVQENIAAFGGDPGRVTVGGESAGATAVCALLAAPAARGLFARAIAQSAYPEPLLSQASGAIMAREVARGLGLADGDLEGVRALREREPERVIAVVKSLFEQAATRDAERFGDEIAALMNPFMPLVGGAVVPRRPLEAARAGELADVDLLIGTNRDEFRLVFGLGMMAIDDEIVGAIFEATFPGQGAEALALYAETRPDASPVDLLAALETDRSYRVGSTLLADAHAAQRPGSTFFYRFSWESAAFDGAIGAAHAVELPFVFDALDTPMARALTGDGAPQALADDVHRAWVAFVVSGNPGHAGLPDWPAYDATTRPVLELAGEHRLLRDPDGRELALWVAPAAEAA